MITNGRPKMHARLLISALLFFSIASAAWSQSSSTSGNCSPIVTEVRGNVDITCSLVSNKIPVFKFSGDVSSRNIRLFTKFINAHEYDIIELNVTVDPREEDQLYFVGDSPAGRMTQLILNDFANGATYTLNAGFYYFRGFYRIRGFFVIDKTGDRRRSVEEVFINSINKEDVLTRGRVEKR